MKNIIPLVVAVILGLAAVYMVSRLMVTDTESSKEPQVSIVIAAKDLEAGEELRPGSCTFKNLPKSAVPPSYLLWENVSLTYGQTLPHEIKKGSYIRFEDIQLDVTLSECVTAGKWLIPVTFSDPTLVKMLKAKDEIAIAATYTDVKKGAVDPASLNTENLAAALSNVEQGRETVVLFPCIEVIGIANEKGMFRETGNASSTIFVSLPPRQAMILLAAQREAELYPILRRRNDRSARNRQEIGSVNRKTFEQIRSKLETAELPDNVLHRK